ncbi:tripartite tricarboxylate transporter substrate binding protein [Roseateles puraquae]|uniref:Twin-arginine translocation pathway signal n=1 Tax=Roseateles puraquae TaxID=431059 RepID=A0A254N9R6_9BURK|nr:tripartite tricarboxylate transporter substrate binding protein [Roseateles puraquae]MDG0854090.1 tripartite tricarboxylate transporter substrate binding protein [Roseateles puraquae]OWR03552.1 Twin-arginine translocation pathway signal [Roseateles puraquae]
MHKILVAGLLALASAAPQAQEAGWPSKPLHFIVPFGPGGANDIVARTVAEATAKQLGQPIIIENKPGAGSMIGATYVAKAAPDGYTFLTPAAGVITNALIKSRMPYAEDDLVPVVMMAVSPSVIVVPADSPVKDLKGLIAASRKGPGLNFATAGTGSTPHFVAEMLKLKAGAKLQIVPFKSGSEGMAAVVGNQVDATSEASPVVLSMVKAGKLRAVASTWNRRIAALPDLPTAQEQGFADVSIGHWSGVFAPKGTPEAILDKLNAAVNAALKSSELRAKLIPLAIDPTGGSREDFRKFLAAEKARLAPVAKAAQMKED